MNRHRFEPVPLALGLLFLVVAGGAAAEGAGWLDWSVGWVAAGLLIATGAAGVVAVVAAARRAAHGARSAPTGDDGGGGGPGPAPGVPA